MKLNLLAMTTALRQVEYDAETDTFDFLPPLDDQIEELAAMQTEIENGGKYRLVKALVGVNGYTHLIHFRDAAGEYGSFYVIRAQ